MTSLQHQVITSVDELVDPVASARMTPLVLRAGAIRAEWVRVNIDGVLVEVGDYSFPVTTQGQSLAERVTLLTPMRRVSGQLNGEAAVPGLLHSWGGASEVRGAMASPASVGVLSLPVDALERTALALGVDVDLPDDGEFRTVDAVDWARLHALLDETLQTGRALPGSTLDPHRSRSLRAALLELAVRTFDRKSRTGRRVPHHLNDMRITRLCEDYAETTHYHDVTLASLCGVSGMSERRVRQAFYECYGMSPTAYLRIAALHHVRSVLLEGPPLRDAVSRAAADFGFWHLSRFAAQYRALFGESPSATLMRRSTSATG